MEGLTSEWHTTPRWGLRDQVPVGGLESQCFLHHQLHVRENQDEKAATYHKTIPFPSACPSPFTTAPAPSTGYCREQPPAFLTGAEGRTETLCRPFTILLLCPKLLLLIPLSGENMLSR